MLLGLPNWSRWELFRRPVDHSIAPKGFLGWHERGYLPHCDFPDLTQLVTFRLADSMPESRRGEWEHLLKIEDVRERRTQLEGYLDRGVGACHLRDPRIGKLCEDALLFFHGQRYELRAWCVMPNHVHVLVHVRDWPLWKMVQQWKVNSAMKARKLVSPERRAPARPDDTPGLSVPSRGSASKDSGNANTGTPSCATRRRNVASFVTSRTTR